MASTGKSIKAEQIALKISIFGALFIVLTSFCFAMWTHSEVILLDGIFFLIVFGMSLVTIRVAQVIQWPDDDQFHFGYAAFEPVLNVAKSIVILVVCVFALVSAVNDILQGGHALAAGPALVYSAILTVSSVALMIILRHYRNRCRSPLLEVDVKNWQVDSVIGAGLLVAFLTVYLLSDTAFSPYLVYADPVMVAVLVLISLPIPVKIIRDNLDDLLGRAPDPEFQTLVAQNLEAALAGEQVQDHCLRILKTGRVLYLVIHILLDTGHPIGTVSELDAIREKIKAGLLTVDPDINIDVCFVGDKKWVE